CAGITVYFEWLETQPVFKASIFPLNSYYFENRIAYTERKLGYASHMVLSVVHKLRDAYAVRFE
ncbi:phage head-tail adapter protein, partial [Staphylococcus pseudintermedius]|uniref:phage head-tail adapter protein n=1 Tax=Staphylococcus pseudintermedius TaxID=283734 RepID=UPI0010200D90